MKKRDLSSDFYYGEAAAFEKKEKKKKTRRKILLWFLAVAILALGFGGGFVTSRLTLDKDIEKIDYILKMYRAHYYDEVEDVVGIFADALLDDYSDYYTKEEYKAIKNAVAGSRAGLGVVIATKKGENEDTLVSVYDVLGNSPAQRAGLRYGDTIVSVRAADGSEAKPIKTTDELTEFLSAVGENEFYLSYIRNGETAETKIKKEEYLQTFVKYFDGNGEYGFTETDGKIRFVREGDNLQYPLQGREDAAVIKYYGFSGTGNGLKGSEGQMEEAMKKFAADGKKNIIIDLRGNGGGVIDIFQEVVRYFIDAEKGSRNVVLVDKDKHGNATEYKSGKVTYSDFGFKSIIILADGGTASASEAFIGAVLDYDRKGIANVVVSGGKTFGKGIMQTTYERVTGEAIKLTTSKLFWPRSDKCIHGVGITTETDDRVINESSYGSAFYDALALCK